MKDHIKLWETWRNISLESNGKNIQDPIDTVCNYEENYKSYGIFEEITTRNDFNQDNI